VLLLADTAMTSLSSSDFDPQPNRLSMRMTDTLDAGAVLDAIGEALYTWNIRTDELIWSENAARLLDVDASRLPRSGTAFNALYSTRSPHGRAEILKADANPKAAEAAAYRFRSEIVTRRGPITIEDIGQWRAGPDGRPALAHGAVRVLGLNTGETLMPLDAKGDSARAMLIAQLDKSLESERRTGRSFALLIGSLPGLLRIDDEHGSDVTHEVVEAVLGRMNQELRRTDIVIRYATNRFAAILTRCEEKDLMTAAGRIIAAVSGASVQTSTGMMPLTMMVGAVTGMLGGRSGRIMLRRAEEALDKARQTSSDLVIYAPDHIRERQRSQERTIADDVLKALNDKRLVLARQPIVHASTRSVAFNEGLLRMIAESGEIISAGTVIPAFERIGRIEILDQCVLQLALDDLTAEPALELSINISVPTLRTETWLNMLSSALVRDASIAPRLIVELTESQAIDDIGATRQVFSTLKALGVRTAIDDFGAGYTSFKHLRGLDVDLLKIDGAFICNLGLSKDDSFFVRTLVDLAQHLGIDTVAEWVRDEESANRLASWGVTYLQGDYLAAAEIPQNRRNTLRRAAA
jgi:diguanylate cyclase (GGDEF)-like protein